MHIIDIITYNIHLRVWEREEEKTSSTLKHIYIWKITISIGESSIERSRFRGHSTIAMPTSLDPKPHLKPRHRCPRARTPCQRSLAAHPSSPSCRRHSPAKTWPFWPASSRLPGGFWWYFTWMIMNSHNLCSGFSKDDIRIDSVIVVCYSTVYGSGWYIYIYIYIAESQP